MRMRNCGHPTVAKNPWWDSQCDNVKRDKLHALNRFRSYPSSSNLSEYKSHRNRLKNIVKEKKHRYSVNLRTTLVESRNDPKAFWKNVKKIRNRSITPNKISVESWFNHFKDLLHIQNQEDLQNFQYEESSTADIFDAPISEEEVRNSIMQIRSGKSGGPDGILIEMLKNTMFFIIPVLTKLFNKLLDVGDFSESWGQSILCPILKKGNVNDPNNYRGISLIDVLNKTFTGILNDRIYKYCIENNKIDEAQAGFRKGYSTTDNIFTLHAMVQKYLSKRGGRFYCLFIDFTKAFDTVDHYKLLSSLNNKGIGGKVFKILLSMYKKLKSCVRANQSFTEFFDCNVGTRQGCKLSPILFSLFINDIVQELRNNCQNGIFISQNIPEIFVLLYADDIANCADTIRNLQMQLNIVELFCKNTGMVVNINKTKIIVFRNGGFLRRDEKWFYQGKPIEVVSAYKYMGLLFTPKLVWTRAKENLVDKANKAVITIKIIQNKLWSLSVHDSLKLFDTMIVPILCYGSEIWGFELAKQIEVVQDRFCKTLLKVPNYTSSISARGECGRLPLCFIYFTRCIKYWLKLIRMEEFRYPKQCYLMLKRLDECNRITWATKVRLLLCRYGFGYVWLSQGVGDTYSFIRIFKERLKDNLLQEWYSDVNESSKTYYYKSFKCILEMETYLSLDIPTKFIKQFSKFRCSAHNLLVERGRHIGIPYQQRICPFCSLNEIEDEYHFVFICPLYSEIRLRYLPDKYKYCRPSV